MSKVTINEVAQLAGVAKSTVSRYLNGGYVSVATREKIDQVIKETNYAPNLFAQSLKAKQTNLVGVIVPRLNSYAVSLTLKGIDEQLRESGYQMLVSNSNQLLEREIESIYSFANQKVAGIILIATSITKRHFQAAHELSVPVLSVGQASDKLPSLIYDDELAGRLIGEYMLAKGHRNLIYMGVPESDIAVGLRRKQGFQEAVKECAVDYYESGFLMEQAYHLFLEIASSEHFQVKTAVVCATDNIAIGVMRAAQSLEMNISITGFGDYEVADLIGLTTVKYPYEEVGKAAAKKIASLTEVEHCQTVFSKGIKLVERRSVKSEG